MKVKGKIITSDVIDCHGDKFTAEAIINAFKKGTMSKEVSYNFDFKNIIGKIIDMKIVETEEGVGIQVIIKVSSEDVFEDIKKELRGVGIYGRVKDSHLEDEINIIDDIELFGASLTDAPAHEDWKIDEILEDE